MSIVKTEILWTRACNLACKYCSMPYKSGKIKKDWELWKKGLQKLKDLGNKFCAVYGAEPLMDMDYLPALFQELNRLGMYHTLITNCSLPDTKQRLKTLIDHGLNSLTVSFDGGSSSLSDKSSRIKSEKGLEILKWFSQFKYRDLSVVFTATKENIDVIPEWIEYFSMKDIHVFFDLIHTDIGNPGTKCKDYDGIDKLLFNTSDEQLLRDFAARMQDMKTKYPNYVHQSWQFLDLLKRRPDVYIKRKWNCATAKSFPSFLTIDYDGMVRICDDFHLDREQEMYFWNLDYEKIKKETQAKTRKFCKGCLWNTHYDAQLVKEGQIDIATYLNNEL